MRRWHLGWCTKALLPHRRGFQTFNGIYHAGTDHYNYMTSRPTGFDFHTNDNINKTVIDTYSTVNFLTTI